MSVPAFHAVVAAAGRGARMGAETPKQYLAVAGATLLEHALAPLLAHPGLRRLVVVVAHGDRRFATLAPAADPRVSAVTGGATRAASVAAGLAALADTDSRLPVVVHDAARPCLPAADLERLLDAATAPDGALLAIPVHDTLKRDDGEDRVAATVDRTALWRALTPQAFPLGALRAALDAAADDAGVTDEAAAMERAGHAPRLVPGDPANVKVTSDGDVAVAAAILAARARGAA